MSDNVDKIVEILQPWRNHLTNRDRQIGNPPKLAEEIAQQINALQSGWISVKDVKDIPTGEWNVYCEDGKSRHLSKSDQLQIVDDKFYWNQPKITHYRPLPKPPNDELNDYFKHPEKY